ncbi:SDR family NAD(P)-dependent oxidoreductase [candidate division KSB1 bacterium]
MGNNELDLSGKNAVITGGSRGIGREIAHRLGEAGCNVLINYVENDDAAREVLDNLRFFNIKAISCKGDVSKPEVVERMVGLALEKLKSIDILVNNAGIWEQGQIGKVDYNHWRRIITSNLDSVFNCCNAVIPYMIEQKSGKIINISSRSARRGEKNSSAYVASKAAVIGFTRSIAREVGKHHVNVNCIAPAWISTDMTEEYIESGDNEQNIINNIPLGRIGQPRDVADIVLFLASDLSNYISGETIFLTGGDF